jgi:DNA-3-methyladenine glycosylase II
LSPLKEQKPSAEESDAIKSKKQQDPDVLPVLGQTSKVIEQNEDPDNAGVSSVPPVPVLPITSTPKGKKGKGKNKADHISTDDEEDTGVLPTPFTPSIYKMLNTASSSSNIPPLPAGLSVAELKKRLDTKKKIK